MCGLASGGDANVIRFQCKHPGKNKFLSFCRIDAFLEKITVAERDDIINTTRYVGIAIPECFSTFLQVLLSSSLMCF